MASSDDELRKSADLPSKSKAVVRVLISNMELHIQKYPRLNVLLRAGFHSIRVVACHTVKRAALMLVRGLPDHWSEKMVFLDKDLRKYVSNHYSMNGEDGIVEYLFSKISPRNRYFVEIGAVPVRDQSQEPIGMQSNCSLLREKGWSGLSVANNWFSQKYAVRQVQISPMNVNEVFRNYGVPNEIDLLSIKFEGQEFWLWSNLSYSPLVVIIEYNSTIGPDESKAMPLTTTQALDGTCCYGSSLLAINRLAESRSYTLVYANGVNAIFVLDNLLANAIEFSFERISRQYGQLKPLRLTPDDQPWVKI